MKIGENLEKMALIRDLNLYSKGEIQPVEKGKSFDFLSDPFFWLSKWYYILRSYRFLIRKLKKIVSKPKLK